MSSNGVPDYVRSASDSTLLGALHVLREEQLRVGSRMNHTGESDVVDAAAYSKLVGSISTIQEELRLRQELRQQEQRRQEGLAVQAKMERFLHNRTLMAGPPGLSKTLAMLDQLRWVRNVSHKGDVHFINFDGTYDYFGRPGIPKFWVNEKGKVLHKAGREPYPMEIQRGMDELVSACEEWGVMFIRAGHQVQGE